MNNLRKKTFLNVKSDTLNSKYDATFVGMVFYSQKWLKGVELAADKIRELSFRYSNADGSSYPIKIYNPERGYILNDIKINDYGNINIMNFKKNFDFSKFPIFVGGDHSITYYTIKSFFNKNNITILHFDAHSDYLSEFEDCPHGSVMYKLKKTKCVKKIIHCGLRGNLNTGPGIEMSKNDGNIVITKNDLSYENIINFIDFNEEIFISIDTDFFDISIAPGTNCPEPNGFLYEEFRKIIVKLINNYNIIGMDIVEFNPKLDCSNITGIMLTNLIIDCISAKKEKNDE